MEELIEMELAVLRYTDQAIQFEEREYGDFWIPKSCVNECPSDEDLDEMIEDEQEHNFEIRGSILEKEHNELYAMYAV